MRSPSKSLCRFGLLALTVGALAIVEPAQSQELPRVSVTRKLAVAGVSGDAHHQDLLGISRIKFQGLIAAELGEVGYVLATPDEIAFQRGDRAPLTLSGRIKEEICDDIEPSQCRIAISWELEDVRGRVVYRVLTRAVEQQSSIEQLRRGLVRGALHSLLKRRRFALQLADVDAATVADAEGPLGFKRCRRGTLALPAAARSAVAPLVWVESGSNLAAGSIISGDGLVLTSASSIEPSAPLRVRFSAQQTVAGQVVAIERRADVALVHVPVSTDTTCVPLGEEQIRTGAQVFGVSSELSEDSAVSLDGAALLRLQEGDGQQWLEVDTRLAHVAGAPLLDEQGRLVAIVSGSIRKPTSGTARVLAVASVLAALNVKPAAVTDSRLLLERSAPRTVEYVGDRDDPPFTLSRRYTYGTSPFARRLRTGSIVAAAIGGAGVAATWIAFRGNPEMSVAAHDRNVILNDLSWVLLGLGAVGIGGSFVWPEGHDVVAGHSASTRELFIGVAGRGVTVGGRI
jgi:S1-C subfamily serine protease